MQELIDKYLDNTLSLEERVQFEKDLVTNPELLQELELEQIIRDAVVDDSLIEWQKDVSETIFKKRKKRTIKKTMFISGSVLSLVALFGVLVNTFTSKDSGNVPKEKIGQTSALTNTSLGNNDEEVFITEVVQEGVVSNRMSGVNAVSIPDAEFLNCLQNDYSSLLNASDELIIEEANNLTGSLACNTGNIIDITGIQYFTSITEFDFEGNDIVDITPLGGLTQLEVINLETNDLEIIPNLTSFTSLREFRASNNQLDNLPVFPSNLEVLTAGNNSLSGVIDIRPITKLKELVIFENDVKGVTGIEANLEMELLDLRENDLDSLADLSALTNLITVDLSENRFQELLGFDLDGILSFSAGINKLTIGDLLILSESDLYPSAFPDITNQATPVTPRVDTVIEGEFWDWVLSFDKHVTTNTYFWFKDGEPFDTTVSVNLEVESMDLGNSGIYHCEIINSNPKLSGVRTITNTRTVVVKEAPDEVPGGVDEPCFTVSNVDFTVNTPSCSDVSFVTTQFKINGDVKGSMKYELNSEEIDDPYSLTLSEEGVYSLVFTDDECEVTLDEGFEVMFDYGGCEPLSFSPNGDGDEDEYYIDALGEVNIYDKSGRLLKTIDAPGSWDGTDNEGTLLPIGHYILVIENGERFGVTLVK